MCLFVFIELPEIAAYISDHVLVHHQTFHFHDYSIDEGAAAIESIFAWSVIRFPSDFSNGVVPSPVVPWPISAFFIFLAHFFYFTNISI